MLEGPSPTFAWATAFCFPLLFFAALVMQFSFFSFFSFGLLFLLPAFLPFPFEPQPFPFVAFPLPLPFPLPFLAALSSLIFFLIENCPRRVSAGCSGTSGHTSVGTSKGSTKFKKVFVYMTCRCLYYRWGCSRLCHFRTFFSQGVPLESFFVSLVDWIWTNIPQFKRNRNRLRDQRNKFEWYPTQPSTNLSVLFPFLLGYVLIVGCCTSFGVGKQGLHLRGVDVFFGRNRRRQSLVNVQC